MEWVLAAYVALVLTAVPVFRTEGRFGLDYSKDHLFTALTGGMVIVSVLNGSLVYTGSPWMLGFFGFAVLSILWCDHNHIGKREAVRLMATIAFVGLASQLPKDFLILACFLPGVALAIQGSIQQIWKKDFCDHRTEKGFTKRTRFVGWGISANHAAAYLTMQGFLGIWLTVNHDVWFSIPTLIVFAGVVLSQCRAAQLSCIVGVATLFPWTIPVLILGGLVIYWKMRGGRESVGHRWLMLRAVYEIWKRFPVFGAGPRCFRHKHTKAVAELNLKDETILGRPGKPGRYQFTVGRRAHNDYAETLAEYGVVGGILAGMMLATLLWTLRGDWILFAGAVAVLVNAALFYPFRDSMVSLPFWTVVATTGLGTQMPVGLVPAIIASASVAYIVYIFAYKPFMANWVSGRKGLVAALHYEPFSTDYLFDLSYEALKQNQHTLAFNCAEKALYHYDGERPEHAVLHNYGQAAMVNGAFGVAKAAYEHALILRPSDPIVLKGLKELHRLLRQMGVEQRKAA